MIHDVDETLRVMLERDVVNGGVDVAFDAPTKDWASRQSKPTINAFLYDIREDLSRRDVAPLPVRNDEGRIVARRPPPRRFRLSYLLTAWTQRPEDEHRLLAQLLATFIRSDQLPTDALAGSLADAGVPTVVTLALPPTQDRSLSDIWTALGGELKPSLDLVVIAPIDPERAFETGPPTREAPSVVVGDIDMDPDDVEAERRRRSALATKPVIAALDEDGSERIQAGADDSPGRTFLLRRQE